MRPDSRPRRDRDHCSHRTLGLLALCLALCAGPAWGIVVSDDPDLHLVAPPSEFEMVGYLSTAYGTTGALIDEWYVLTAGHAVAPGTGGTFTLHLEQGPVAYSFAEKFFHPDPNVDLAVVRLKRSTGLQGYEINQTTYEQNREGILLGFGMSGTGDSVIEEGGDPAYPKGLNRVGYNRIDMILTQDGATLLKMDFDDPTTSGTYGSLGADKEAMVALGDSGGPTFIRVGDTLKLVGVHVSVMDLNRNDVWPDYGDISYDVRVREYKDWILSVVPDQSGDWTGDFDGSGAVDASDFDLLETEIGNGGTDLWYDLTHDQAVDWADTEMLALDFIGTQHGDTDVNGAVDGGDLSVVAANWLGDVSGWSRGDFTGDGRVDGADLSLMAANWLWGAAAAGEATEPMLAIPEPASILIVAAAGIPVLLKRRA